MERIKKFGQKEFNENGLVRYQHYKIRKKQFSENKRDKRVSLSSIESNRGGGRSILIGGIPGVIGYTKGKKIADKADKEGKNDTQILEESSRAGAKTGAIAGGIGGLVTGAGIPLIASSIVGNKLSAARIAGNALQSGLIGTGLGSLGGYLGAKKNTRTRLEKRRKIEDNNRY